MSKTGQVISGSFAAVALTGTAYLGAESIESFSDYQTNEVARAQTADPVEHSVLSERVMENGTALGATALGTLAFGGVTFAAFWGIYATREKKPVPTHPGLAKYIRVNQP